MKKFNVISNNENENLKSFYGELKLLSEKKGLQQKVELWILNDINTANNWRFENLEEHRQLFAETPILIAYVDGKIGDGHNFTHKYNNDGTEFESFISPTAERIVGYFKNESDIRIEIKDEKKWIVGTGWIWQWYAQELVVKLKKQEYEGMSVSVEALIEEKHMDGNIEVFTKYQILGTTILGDDVPPAVRGANIKVLSELGIKQIRKETLRVASIYQDNDINNPQNIKLKGEAKKMEKKDIQELFPDFKILGIKDKTVALLSLDKNEFFIATIQKDGDNFKECEKTLIKDSAFLGTPNNAIEISLNEILDSSTQQIKELSLSLEEKNKDIEELKKQINVLQAQELCRRKDSVKASIKNRLTEIKSHSAIDFCDDEFADLLTEEKIAEFITKEDKKGNFIGEQVAQNEVDSRCMNKILAQTTSTNNMQKKVFAWEILDNKKNYNEVGNIDSSINRLSKING